MSDDDELIASDAIKLTAVIATVAGAFVGWVAGSSWEDVVGGAIIAPLAWLGLMPFQALREIGGPLAREVWGRQLPWVVIALVVVGLAVERGIDL